MAKVIPDPRSFEDKLLAALGLSDKKLSSLSINVAVGERPTVNFSMFIEDVVDDSIVELFKEYVIVEAPTKTIHPDEADDDLTDSWTPIPARGSSPTVTTRPFTPGPFTIKTTGGTSGGGGLGSGGGVVGPAAGSPYTYTHTSPRTTGPHHGAFVAGDGVERDSGFVISSDALTFTSTIAVPVGTVTYNSDTRKLEFYDDHGILHEVNPDFFNAAKPDDPAADMGT